MVVIDPTFVISGVLLTVMDWVSSESSCMCLLIARIRTLDIR